MTTPITDFVKEYAKKDASRFHMPGHKGKSFLGCESLDITEISGADVLYSASGIIAESESNATALFASGHTFYSTEGSSLSIKAMLALIKKKTPSGHRTRILAARNVHKAFIYACAILDIEPIWIYPEQLTHLCSCEISPEHLDTVLNDLEVLPQALYITSPDYLGNVADIKGLSEVCHRYGILLLVDNAHGAYLAFLEDSMHPLALGADMCCDSAHKTLPVLTGGSYLHISKSYKEFSVEEIRSTISVFASTSPSYLILQSLDICNAYISDGYSRRLNECIRRIRVLKQQLSALGFPPISGTYFDELKIVFSKSTCGHSGTELAEHLSDFNIEVEFADRDYAVLMLTPENSESDLRRVYDAISTLKQSTAFDDRSELPMLDIPKRATSVRDAIFCESEIINATDACGRICAAPTVSCPPAVPIVISGEIIDEAALKLLSYYGINKIEVIK